MKRNLQNHKNELIAGQFFVIAISIMFSIQTNAQSYVVKGKVSISTRPVRYASISFVDNSDTTKVYTSLTDNLGKYQIEMITTSVEPIIYQPTQFTLDQNYPNPFSTSTTISYKLNKRSDVQVTIYDILGREIKTFKFGVQPIGTYQLFWDGTDNYGNSVATGMYFYRLQAGSETQVRKMIFGPGEGKIIGSSSRIHSSPTAETNQELNHYSQERNFTVRIENTDRTSPPIAARQIDNIVIRSDTTLNFFVTGAVVIQLDSIRQIISGFGAANILRWRPDMTTDQIVKAFGTDEGQIGLTILHLRVPSDANEFSYNVPTAKAAYSLGVKIIASPWSPPASMKTNNNIVGGRLRESAYADYAAHLKSFADYMASNSAPLYAISVQNEPDVTVTYESCYWNASEMLKFVKENAPAIGTDIIVPESFNFNHTISDAILNDSTAASHVAIIGGHIYGGGITNYPLAVSKGKEIWMTEHLDTDTSWTKVLATGKEIHDCIKVGMSAYIWWYIVRFYGPIKEDGNVSKRGYVMSQYARFVRPGFFKVDATENPQPGVYVTAFKNGSRVVIITINSGSASIDQTFKIQNGTVTHFTPYVTSETKNCVQESEIIVSNSSFTVTLNRSCVTTFVSN